MQFYRVLNSVDKNGVKLPQDCHNKCQINTIYKIVYLII